MPLQSKLDDASYDHGDFGAEWWLARSRSEVHQRAYKTIASVVKKNCAKAGGPKHIIDYACGPAFLLGHLRKTFPKAKLTGVDESQGMLAAGESVLKRFLKKSQNKNITLLRHPLPDFGLKEHTKKAEIVVFSFPDFRIDGEGKTFRRLKKAYPDHWKAAKHLCKKLGKQTDPEQLWEPPKIFYERLATENMRQLVKKNGWLVRVEYAPVKRKDWDESFTEQYDWIMGVRTNLDKWTKPLASFDSAHYSRSKVILDVFEQTQDDDDKKGGFSVNIYKAK